MQGLRLPISLAVCAIAVTAVTVTVHWSGGGAEAAHVSNPLDDVIVLAGLAPAGQQVALSDGLVDEEEYRSALQASASCLDARPGITATATEHGRSEGRLVVGITTETVEGLEVPETTFRECVYQHSTFVDVGYQLTAAAPRQALRSQAKRAIEKCLVEEGVVAPGDYSADELVAAAFERPIPAPARRCVELSPAFFVLPYPLGGLERSDYRYLRDAGVVVGRPPEDSHG